MGQREAALDAKRLLFASEGRDHQTVVDFAAELKAHGGDPADVRHVCMAMSAAFAKGAGLALPQADISYDRFHVVAMAIQATDEVRREELRTEPEEVAAALLGADPKTRRNLLWGMRKNPVGWTAAQTTTMHWLQRSALKSARAWRLRMALRDVCAGARQHNSAQQAVGDLAAWLSWVRRCRLEPFKKLATTIKERFDAVVRGMLDHRSNVNARVDERAASTGQVRGSWLPNSQELHRRRLPASVTLEEPPGSSVQRCCCRQMRLSRSTRNGIVPSASTDDGLELFLALDGPNIHTLLEQRAILAGEFPGVLERNVGVAPDHLLLALAAVSVSQDPGCLS